MMVGLVVGVGVGVGVVISLGFDLVMGLGMAMVVSFSLFTTLFGWLLGGCVYMVFRFGSGDVMGFD